MPRVVSGFTNGYKHHQAKADYFEKFKNTHDL